MHHLNELSFTKVRWWYGPEIDPTQQCRLHSIVNCNFFSPFSLSLEICLVLGFWWEEDHGDDDAVVRRSSEETDADHHRGKRSSNIFITFFINLAVVNGGRDADTVRKRGQANGEREEIQRVVRKLKAEEREEDWADQGQSWSPQVHPLASSFQTHLKYLN